ncbi:hydroxyacid dehydrogenase [Ancylobacter oerskovii]|uniref:Hydroxyacid dehydrogenase n=1 Tax=Ancylobacter oerskovii TaxID=459519 RepID=A0ABW4YYA1_9HYPH|nr:hydroxyacid dehydrogenase [Ancylobacter oerskovii]MBS7541712.1 hydroxyacid dehydrogenase [Ancylobacter oerskovii]
MTLKVLMTARTLAPPGVALLEEAGCSLSFLPGETAAELAEAVRSVPYDAIISRTLALPGELIEAAPALRLIARHGVGYNNVDLASATRRGIPVLVADAGNGQSVAELTVGLALAAARRIAVLDAGIRAGRWDRAQAGQQLAGRTAGLVAFGAISRRVAVMLRAIGMRIVVHDPHIADRARHDVEWADTLDDLLAASDLVSLHCPLTPETRHLIGPAQIARLRRGAILVNTARGGLVDEAALVEALASGRLAGAGLDTFEDEPLPAGHPFLALPNVVLTPHMGGSTDAALDAVAVSAARNVIDVLIDRKIDRRLLVNPAVLERQPAQ